MAGTNSASSITLFVPGPVADVAEIASHVTVSLHLAPLVSADKAATSVLGGMEPGPADVQARDLCVTAVSDLGRPIADALAGLAEPLRRTLQDTLDSARAKMRLINYGLVEDVAERRIKPPVAASGRDTYLRFRDSVVELVITRRKVSRWLQEPPPNAPNARGQFNGDLANYTRTYQATIASWPVIASIWSQIADSVENYSDECLQGWAKEKTETSSLDDAIKSAVAGAWVGLINDQPGYHQELLSSDAKAHSDLMRSFEPAARLHSNVFSYAKGGAPTVATQELLDKDSLPERILARSSVWRFPFLVHRALELNGLLPGDLAYAAATSTLREAEKAAQEKTQENNETAVVLGWGSFGFGLLSAVPVVGWLFGATALAVSLGLSFLKIAEYDDQRKKWNAAGPLARQFGFSEPDGVGLVIEVLGLASDLALPILGRALTVASRPAARALAAARLKTAQDATEKVIGIATLALEANAAHLAKIVERTRLDQVEGGA